MPSALMVVLMFKPVVSQSTLISMSGMMESLECATSNNPSQGLR